VSPAPSQRVVRGDWQTPAALARAVVDRVAALTPAPACVVEPTCGAGSFLAAAAARFPGAQLRGYEIDPTHVAAAQALVTCPRGQVVQADVFSLDWAREAADWPAPVLVLGNPPWVTSAALGRHGGDNRPAREAAGLRGLAARTGRSNFDVSEWLVLRLLRALAGRTATVAVLIKASVARRVLVELARAGLPARPRGLWQIDAARHFGARVDAGLLVVDSLDSRDSLDSLGSLVVGASAAADAGAALRCPIYPDLAATAPTRQIALADGELIADLEAHARSLHLRGASAPEWRSGVKHDCAAAMEIQGPHDLEDSHVYPLLRAAELARGEATPRRWLVLPQTRLGEDTAGLAARAPRTWAHLQRHAAALAARKSSIYRGQPPFAVFGVGAYTFAPFKVAISGLHKQPRFVVVPPHRGRPVVLDDTSYFLPFADEAAAREAHALLCSPPARDFLEARAFWADKRPIHKGMLQRLDLARLRDDPRARLIAGP